MTTGRKKEETCCARHRDGFNCASNLLLVFVAEGGRCCATQIWIFFSFGAFGWWLGLGGGGGGLFDNVDTIVPTLLSASPSVASSDSGDHYVYSEQAKGANSSLISAQQSRRCWRLMPGGEEGGHELNAHVPPSHPASRPKS